MRDELQHYPSFDDLSVSLEDYVTKNEFKMYVDRELKMKLDISRYSNDKTNLDFSLFSLKNKINLNSYLVNKALSNSDNIKKYIIEEITKENNFVNASIHNFDVNLQNKHKKLVSDVNKTINNINSSLTSQINNKYKSVTKKISENKKVLDLNITKLFSDIKENKKEFSTTVTDLTEKHKDLKELILQLQKERQATDEVLTTVADRVTTLENNYKSLLVIINDTLVRVENLEDNQDRLLGAFVYTYPDSERGIYELKGQTVTDAKLARFIEEKDYIGFSVNGDDVTLPDLRGYTLVARGAKGITNELVKTYNQSILRHNHKTKGTSYIYGDNSGDIPIMKYDVDGYSTYNTGGDYNRPYSVGMSLCIIGSYKK